jgi:hypothetical protein
MTIGTTQLLGVAAGHAGSFMRMGAAGPTVVPALNTLSNTTTHLWGWGQVRAAHDWTSAGASRQSNVAAVFTEQFAAAVQNPTFRVAGPRSTPQGPSHFSNGPAKTPTPGAWSVAGGL